MKNQVTTIEQSRRLIKLSVSAKKASCRWESWGANKLIDNKVAWVWSDYELRMGFNDSCDSANYKVIPAFTVADLLRMMPTRSESSGVILYTLSPYGVAWSLSFHPSVADYNCTAVDLVALLYDAIVTLLSNGYEINA